MSFLKISVLGLFGLCCGQALIAQGVGSGGGRKPYLVSGNIGTSANFYSSDETIKTRPSFAWNVYGNLEARTEKVSLPLYFVVNQYSNSNASPYVQIGISPAYKWARLHLGYRYIPFSPFTFEGQSFRGAGIELYPKMFRFAAFYGRLNKAVNEDTTRGRFRAPQYSRTGYGLKLGIGNERRFFDIMYFHAKDDSGSAAAVRGSGSPLRAQENAVLGTSFKLTIKNRLIWTGDAAISGLVQDLAGKTFFDSSKQTLENFIGRFLPDNNSLTADVAGQSSLTYYAGIFNSSLAYRRVQPGFKSLGTPYMIDDIELWTWNNNLVAAKGKLAVSTNLSQQHNNLDKNLLAELRTRVGILNINTILGQHFDVGLNFTGYDLKQRNDRNSLADSLRLNDTLLLKQNISQYGISPSYNITTGNKVHFISGNLNVQVLNDKNPKTASQNNSNNISSLLNYTLSFADKYYSLTLYGIYSRYKQDTTIYTSVGPTAGASFQLLKNRNLNLQGNVGLLYNTFTNGETRTNTTYSASSSYQHKNHNFSFFINYVYTPANPIRDVINQAVPYTVTTKNMYGGVSYNYLF